MRCIMLLFMLCGEVFGQNVDYQALTGSMMYLNRVWVEQPRQYQHELQMQQAAPRAVPQHGAGYQAPPRVPTCHQVPIYSVIDGSILTYRTNCY